MRWRRSVAWLAMAVVIVHAALPGLAMARVATPGAIPVCTAAGIAWLPLDGEPARPAPRTPCDFCLAQAMVVALTAPPLLAPPQAPALGRAHASRSECPSGAAAHLRPPARAPPQRS